MEKQSMSVDLAEFIKQQILDGHLSPGDRIVETKVAKDLGISQTPVREAIRQLSGEGIITIVPNKGPMVRTFEMKDIFEVYSLRSMLEGLAIRLAVQFATDEDIEELVQFFEEMKRKMADDSVDSLLQDSVYLHQSIIRLSNHSRLSASYDSITFHISLAARILGRVSTKHKEVEQHAELIDALVRRDPDHAEKVMRKHILRSFNEFRELPEAENWAYDDINWL
ncbi:DNA-binding GntR family transcriptional regulator [Paenibacillus baekrokdamisoli]|uniref:GntR family transcriptional regulator n=1 Tax=Paenibacillus baekrokdamisoli TaxID=1712516 RepID=UPI0017CC1D1D|nr:GntR family transcriptional regulator [Paenibacillus baekrokdamisoli]MBB3071366.1 DNA-binding GntR family transcriptional regulator [Paenibacillus baekrokdamisoli]